MPSRGCVGNNWATFVAMSWLRESGSPELLMASSFLARSRRSTGADRFRLASCPGQARLEIASKRLGQLVSGHELALLAGDEVLEPSGESIGLRVAANLQRL
jgi:hypothetical protein